MNVNLKRNWWKIVAVVLVMYALVGGMLGNVPRLPILNETIRNLYYHVTMWFGMMILMLASVVYAIKSLRSNKAIHDVISRELALAGMVMGFIGIATGSLWAKFTWGAFWVNDAKLNGAAITMLVYLAYIILRQSVDDAQKRAKLAAVYNIFAFVLLIVFLLILPRTTDSLHPGNGGNPGFSAYEQDLNSGMRMIFYPAIIGWTLTGLWIAQLRIRMHHLEKKL